MIWHFLASALPVALGGLLLSCGIEDIRTREIANWKNAAIALLAHLWWVSIGLLPWPWMAVQVAVALVVFAVFIGAFALGQMGGGDVKLIGALALWLSPPKLLSVLMVMAIVGGALTVLLMVEERVRRPGRPLEVPYGVAIVVAALLALREPLLNQFA